MRVTVEERSELRDSGIEVEGLEVVEHVSVAILDADTVSVRLPVEYPMSELLALGAFSIPAGALSQTLIYRIPAAKRAQLR